MSFPAVMTWCYFILLSTGGGKANLWQQTAYSGGKILQLGFPVLFLFLRDRRWPWPAKPRWEGLGLGLGFGLLVAAAMLGLYFGYFRNSAAFASTSVQVRHKLEEFGLTSAAGYFGLAAFIVVIHSLLEEYYWRWFVFGHLRELVPVGWAVGLSSLGFMAHHVIVLWYYFPGHFVDVVVPFSLAVALGGAIWATLYQRTGSIYASWLSHLLVDASIFAIGWDLLQRPPAV
jgi:membrane protease YdiL (CAAX protease family)